MGRGLETESSEWCACTAATRRQIGIESRGLMSGGCAWPVNCRVKRPREPSKASQTWPIYILSRAHSPDAFPHLQPSKILIIVKIHDLSSFRAFFEISIFSSLQERERERDNTIFREWRFATSRGFVNRETHVGMAVNEQRVIKIIWSLRYFYYLRVPFLFSHKEQYLEFDLSIFPNYNFLSLIKIRGSKIIFSIKTFPYLPIYIFVRYHISEFKVNSNQSCIFFKNNFSNRQTRLWNEFLVEFRLANFERKRKKEMF